MCDSVGLQTKNSLTKTVPVDRSVGMVLAHDITEIRPGEFKGRAFKKGHVVRKDDVCHLQRLGKERLFVLNLSKDDMHEDEAAYILADALKGSGVGIQGEPSEGKINLIAERDGLLKINRKALLELNMLGEVMCATLHNNSIVEKGKVVAGTRAIPLVVKKKIVEDVTKIAEEVQRSSSNGSGQAIIEVKEIRRPRAGVVITGNEVYHGRIKDAFAPIIREKIKSLKGEITGLFYAPDDKLHIGQRLQELIDRGADLLIVTGGMSVDPDDVTRFAIKEVGADETIYGSAVLPGAMFLVSFITQSSRTIPVLGVPACGMYHKITVFDLVLPRVLAGEKIGRRELSELGHGGLCLQCDECLYPVCPFGKES